MRILVICGVGAPPIVVAQRVRRAASAAAPACSVVSGPEASLAVSRGTTDVVLVR